MPRTTAKQKKRCKPWFNTECKDALKARQSALVRFKTNITTDNLSNFRVARAKARRACRVNKRASWQQYVSRLNSRTTLKSTWDRTDHERDRRHARPFGKPCEPDAQLDRATPAKPAQPPPPGVRQLSKIKGDRLLYLIDRFSFSRFSSHGHGRIITVFSLEVK